MKVGDRVKLNVDRIIENYTQSLMTSNATPDYKRILWAKENRDEIFIVKTVLYNSLVKIDGQENMFSLDELKVI